MYTKEEEMYKSQEGKSSTLSAPVHEAAEQEKKKQRTLSYQLLAQKLSVPHFTEGIKLVKNKKIIPFVGITGDGKSTLISYLVGLRFKFKEEKRGVFAPDIIKAATVYPKIATSDEKHDSCTKYCFPYIDESEKKLNYRLLDTPGFLDTGEPEDAVCASVHTELCFKSSLGVAAIALVLNWNHLDTKTATDVKELFSIFGKLFVPPYDAYSDSIILFVTHAREKDTVEEFKNSCVTLGTHLEKKLKQANLTDEKKFSLTLTLDCIRMLQSLKHIVLIKPNSYETDDLKTSIVQHISEINDSRKEETVSSNHISFINYDPNRSAFDAGIQIKILEISNLFKRYIELKEEIIKKTHRKQEYAKRATDNDFDETLNALINSLESKNQERIDEKTKEALLATEKQLSEVLEEISSNNKKTTEYSKQITKLENKIKELRESDKEITVLEDKFNENV
jgi:hypothetical protein